MQIHFLIPLLFGSVHGYDERFVYTSFTYPHSYPMLEAGARTWRKHIRSVFVESAPTGVDENRVRHGDSRPAYLNLHDELWVYSDYPPINEKVPFIPRSLATIRLANSTFHGQFDWLLYSDDEGIFLMDRVSRLVEGLDPSVPYYLCDNIMDSCNHYHEGQNISVGESEYCVIPSAHASHTACPRNAAAVPCTSEAVIASRKCHDTPDHEGWHFCNGNQGSIISRGLIDSIVEGDWKRCERAGRHPYSDVALGNCIWEFGYAPTNPTDTATVKQFSRCIFGRYSATQYTELANKSITESSMSETTSSLLDAATTWVKHHTRSENGFIVDQFWQARERMLKKWQ